MKNKLSPELYQVIFENANDAIFFHELSVKGMPGRFLAVNRQARKRLGYSLGEFLSMSPHDIDTGEVKINMPRIMDELHKTGIVIFEMIHLAKDGTKIPVEISSSLIDLDGVKRVVSVARDISKRKKAQQMLSRSEYQYRTVFELSPQAIILLNQKGNIVAVNGRVQEWLGYEDKQIMGKKLTELPFLSTPGKKQALQNFYRRIAGEEIGAYELDFITITKEKKVGLIQAAIIENSAEGEIHDLIMISDITEKKKIEQELLRSEKNYRLAVEILHRIGANLELKDIFAILIKELKTQLKCSGCAMLTRNREDSFEIMAEEGFREKFGQAVFSIENQAIAYIVNQKKTLFSGDIAKSELSGCAPPGTDIRSLACVPVLVEQKVQCIIHLDSEEIDSFSPDDLKFVEFLAELIAFAVERSNLFHRFKEFSIKDGLTGCFNRRKFDMDFTDEIYRAKRYHRKFSFLIADIDWFKKYNDFHGHIMGDQLLGKLVSLLRRESRETDKVYRYGGEEFALILPETEKKEALEVAERIRKAVWSESFAGEEKSQPQQNVTISIGVATFPDDAEKGEKLIETADKSLYQAKSKGRNKVCPEG